MSESSVRTTGSPAGQPGHSQPLAESSQRPMSRWRLALMSLGLLASVVAVLGGVGYLKYLQIATAMATPPPPEMPTTVNMTAGTPTTFRRSSVVVGNVLAPQSLRLRTELTGVVTEVPMQPGQLVKQGDVLVRFDVRSETAELKSAQANRNLAVSALKRSEQLANAKASSQHEYDIATAELARAEAEVERLDVMIDKKTLRAPFDAQAGMFDLHVGQYLDAGSEITSLEGVQDYIHIDFSLPAHVADWTQVGDQVQIRAGEQDRSWDAVIIAIDSQADAISRGVVNRARLQAPPRWLQPNDSVRVSAEFGPPIEAIAIPSTAIRRGPTGTSVFVAQQSTAAGTESTEPQLRAVVRDVTVGSSSGSLTYVITGLKLEDVVVTDGSFKVTPGMLLVDAATLAAAPADASPANRIEASGADARNAGQGELP